MIPLTFRRLEVFIAVVDAGSFVGAADKLGISHPSVSNHVRALEDMM
ncbi:LysR family transcriptional regulator, partial [Actibacterium sp.]